MLMIFHCSLIKNTIKECTSYYNLKAIDGLKLTALNRLNIRHILMYKNTDNLYINLHTILTSREKSLEVFILSYKIF